MKDRMEIQQLRKMGKRELVRLVQDCDNENRKLAEESERKQNRIQDLEQRLVGLQEQIADMEDKQIKMQLKYQEPGSLADSMIQVNGVIAAAQNAAGQYLERIREMESARQAETEEILTMARLEAKRILSKAKTGAAQIREASANVLKSLQTEIDRMLLGARGEYEQKTAGETPAFGAEAAVNTDVCINADTLQKPCMQPIGDEAEKVPHLNDILYPAETEKQGTAGGEAMTPKEKMAPDETEGLVDELSEEIQSVINDLTYKTQHLGEHLKNAD